jgi:hypothetical protein
MFKVNITKMDNAPCHGPNFFLKSLGRRENILVVRREVEQYFRSACCGCRLQYVHFINFFMLCGSSKQAQARHQIMVKKRGNV